MSDIINDAQRAKMAWGKGIALGGLALLVAGLGLITLKHTFPTQNVEGIGQAYWGSKDTLKTWGIILLNVGAVAGLYAALSQRSSTEKRVFITLIAIFALTYGAGMAHLWGDTTEHLAKRPLWGEETCVVFDPSAISRIHWTGIGLASFGGAATLFGVGLYANNDPEHIAARRSTNLFR